MNGNSPIKMFKEKKALYYTDEYAPDIFLFLLAFAAVHFVFLIAFLLVNVTEMVVYNIFSVLMFLLLAGSLIVREKVNYGVMDVLISGEIILHQVLAVAFVGTGAGFQFLLLGLFIPAVYYSLKKYFIIITVTKAVLSLLVFMACDYLFKYVFTPVYQITDSRWLFCMYYFCILALFVTVAKGTIESYTKYKVKLEKEYQFHKETVEKQMAMQQNVIQTIADIVEARDETTGQHTERTKEYVHQILLRLKTNEKYKEKLTEKYIQDVTSAAVLHDIGKIKISDNILRKPERLTDEEFEVIKTHTIEGSGLLDICYKSIDNEEYYEVAKNVVLYHHERWDGTGYPHRLAKEEIPLEARIMAVADVYDALMSKRSYKERFEKSEALIILQEGRGTQFDPDVLDCFLEYIEEKKGVRTFF